MDGARVCVREGVGALRAEGCVARLRLGEEAVLARDGLEVRDRVLGAERVAWARSLEGAERLTTPALDRVVGRGAVVEGVGALEVALVRVREGRSGLAVDLRALGGVVLLDAPIREGEATTRRVLVGRSVSAGRVPPVERTTLEGRAVSVGRAVPVGRAPVARRTITLVARGVGVRLAEVPRVEPTRAP